MVFMGSANREAKPEKAMNYIAENNKGELITGYTKKAISVGDAIECTRVSYSSGDVAHEVKEICKILKVMADMPSGDDTGE